MGNGVSVYTVRMLFKLSDKIQCFVKKNLKKNCRREMFIYYYLPTCTVCTASTVCIYGNTQNKVVTTKNAFALKFQEQQFV